MQQKIQTFLNTCLRRIFNIRWPEKIRNEELWERAGQEPVAKQILRRKWGWIGHTLRKPASSTTRQALTWNPQGKRKRGRPRNSWRRDTEAELLARSGQGISDHDPAGAEDEKRKKKKKKDRKKHKKDKHKHKKAKKHKHSKKEGDAPVQLSKFWNTSKQDSDSESSDEPQRSAISGKKIKRKVKKSKADRERDKNRAKLLKFLNSTM
nr:hypothetical protein BaRGS_031791 [Batillaria attramentaria]